MEQRRFVFWRKEDLCFGGKKMVVLREGDPPNYGKFWFLTRSLFINLKNFLGLRFKGIQCI